MVRFVRVQLAAATSPFPFLAAFGSVTWGERPGAKTRVRGIDLAAGTGAWAIGFQAWEGTRENPAATTNSWWDASSFGFTGREHDLDSELIYARARFGDPATGSWLREDPVNAREVLLEGGRILSQESSDDAFARWDGFENPGAQHRYSWPFANPVTFRDPLGQQADVAALGIGALSGYFLVGVAKRVDSVSATVVNALLNIARLLFSSATAQALMYVELLAVLGWAAITWATSGMLPPVPDIPTKSIESQPSRPGPRFPKPPGMGCKGAFDTAMGYCLMRPNVCVRFVCVVGAALGWLICTLKGGA